METPTHQTSDLSVPQTCLDAGAVLHERDGHIVATSYGSVPGEMSVCMKSVGLTDRCDLGTFMVHGDQNLLDHALIERLGDPAIAPATARRQRSVWYLRLDQRRALLVGPHRALASEPPLGARRDRVHLPHQDIRSSLALLSVIGPRAGRLLHAAELPGELAIGAVGGDPAGDGIVAILRESQRRFLIVARSGHADELWLRLLATGKPFGAAFVGLDALALLDVSSAG